MTNNELQKLLKEAHLHGQTQGIYVACDAFKLFIEEWCTNMQKSLDSQKGKKK
jgi:hypothetical protein